MSETKDQKLVKQNPKRSSILAFVTLIIASLSLVLFLVTNHLDEIKKQDLSKIDRLEDIYKLKQSVDSKYLAWLYADYFEKRAGYLDTKLLNISAEKTQTLLGVMSQEPLRFLPVSSSHLSSSHLSSSHASIDRPIATAKMVKLDLKWLSYKTHCQKLTQLVQAKNFVPSLKAQFEQNMSKCSALVASLEQWFHPLKTLNMSQTTEISIADFLKLTKIQTDVLDSHTTQILNRYSFAWFRFWSAQLLDQLEDRTSELKEANHVHPNDQCADLKTQAICISKLINEIKNLNKLDQKIADLSIDLHEIFALKLKRLVQQRWRAIWQSYSLNRRVEGRSQQNQKHSTEHELLSRLYQLYKLPQVAEALLADSKSTLLSKSQLQPQPKPQSYLSVPKDLLVEWKNAFNQISHLSLAKTLERLGYNHQSSLEDVKQVWFIPLLTPRDQQAIFLELQALALRLGLKELFDNPHQVYTEAVLERIQKQLKALEQLSLNETWQERLKVIKGLINMQWRSVKGKVTCEEKNFKLHKQWQDLGMIDRLVPLIYLKSDRDQTKLKKRIGRVHWGLKNHHTFYIALYDEDQITQVDLLFEDRVLSVAQLLHGLEVKRHGCIYSVQFIDLELLQLWLASN